MRPLRINQIESVLQMVEQRHKFGFPPSEEQIEEIKQLHPKWEWKCIKYVDMVYDSREGFPGVWRVAFRTGNESIVFSSNFSQDQIGKPYTNLFDWVMDFLKCEYEPKEFQLEKLNEA